MYNFDRNLFAKYLLIKEVSGILLTIYSHHTFFSLSKKYNKKIPPIHTIKYEELIANPQYILKLLCQYLELSFEDNMNNYQSNSRDLVSKDEISWKRETLGPVLSNNFNKWKSYLSNYEILLLENLCYKYFSIYNYQISNNIVISKFLKIFISLHSNVIKIFSYIYVFYLCLMNIKCIRRNY